MKKKLTVILSSQFARGTLVVFVASNIANLTQFIFHFLSGRFLGKALYGDLASIISLLGIISIIQAALGLTIVKSIASEGEKKLPNFIKWINFYTIWLAILTAILTFIFSSIIGKFLNISNLYVIYFLVPLLAFHMVTTAQRSMLQGLLKFNSYALSFIIDSLFKIFFTVLFFYLGWQIYGALTAMLLAAVGGLLVTRVSLIGYLNGKRQESPNLRPLFKYSSAVFIQGLSLTGMYSTDLLLVKHFFSSDQAGIYASLAILGRIVFFGANPIVNVMFPIIAKKHSLNEKYWHIFYFSLFILLAISSIVTIFYYVFPSLPITILYGKSYLEGAPLLWYFGIFMMLLALAMLLTQFYLSINKTRIVYLFPIASISQVILIWLNHSSLQQVISMSIYSAALLDILLFVYFVYLKLNSKQ